MKYSHFVVVVVLVVVVVVVVVVVDLSIYIKNPKN